MLRLDRFISQAEQAATDIKLLNVFISGRSDTKEMKEATKVFVLDMAKNFSSIAKQLEKETEKLV